MIRRGRPRMSIRPTRGTHPGEIAAYRANCRTSPMLSFRIGRRSCASAGSTTQASSMSMVRRSPIRMTGRRSTRSTWRHNFTSARTASRSSCATNPARADCRKVLVSSRSPKNRWSIRLGNMPTRPPARKKSGGTQLSTTPPGPKPALSRDAQQGAPPIVPHLVSR